MGLFNRIIEDGIKCPKCGKPLYFMQSKDIEIYGIQIANDMKSVMNCPGLTATFITECFSMTGTEIIEKMVDNPGTDENSYHCSWVEGRIEDGKVVELTAE